MTAPTKAAPKAAKKTRTPAVKIDFSSVTVADGGNLSRAGASALDGTPVLEWLQDSWATKSEHTFTDPKTKEKRTAYVGKSKTVTVPTAQAESMVRLLRTGAARLNLGLRCVPSTPANGKVTIAFAAKTPRKVTPKVAAK